MLMHVKMLSGIIHCVTRLVRKNVLFSDFQAPNFNSNTASKQHYFKCLLTAAKVMLVIPFVTRYSYFWAFDFRVFSRL